MMCRITFLWLLCVLTACASVQKPVANAEQSPESLRHLAWLEGNYQTGYEPDREVARQRLARWEGNPPDPSDTDEYLNYLSVLDASGRSAEAEKKIKAYLVANPGEKRAIFLLGVHYLRNQKEDLANHFFSQLEKDSDFAWKSLLFNNLGMMALRDNNRAAALEYFEKATRESPRVAAPHVNLGAMYLESHNYGKAQEMFSRALQIDDKFEDAVVGLGSALEGQGKFQEAHEVYSGFINDNPDALSVLYNNAVLLGTRLNQKQLAREMMLRYIQRGGKETARAQTILENWR